MMEKMGFYPKSKSMKDKKCTEEQWKHSLFSKKQSLSCIKCNLFFSNRKLLYAHIRDRHWIHFKCNDCQSQFSNQRLFDQHLCGMSTDSEWKCIYDGCEKVFKLREYWMKHLRRHRRKSLKIKHIGNRKQCKICLKTFSNNWVLKIHGQIHTGVRPYECEYCFKLFSYPSSKRKHVKYHCKQRKKNKQNAKYFVFDESVQRKKKGVCDVCDESFQNILELQKHYSHEHRARFTFI